VATLVCIVLVLFPRHAVTGPSSEARAEGLPTRWAYGLVVGLALAAASPVVAAVVALVVAVSYVGRRPGLVTLVSAALAALVAIYTAAVQLRHRPGVGFGWVQEFTRSHHMALAAVLLLGAATLDRGRSSTKRPTDDAPTG
jgi:4-amino-4-deoxy-L-arabinose transferase-like glycosyltransferase